ncbi:hypothetical protein Acr_00g0089460 [Actinidia rufa]|uniref:Reverse transcriptase domain-containing protein n=1 Tax=Actinidia rufa TaxID=165716 RepID=A0A7J0DWS5_9ERIC|nr:hypothetical protein Acr_00g0089460 [Actinidia rufa]
MQRRLNPNMKEAVRGEVLKLLDAGIIYPISDSKWVSPTQVVPKKSGIEVALEDQDKSTFTCPFSTYAYKRMPFGLCNAPGTFQMRMISIFSDMVEKILEVFMDDFSMYGDTFESCLEHLECILERCEESHLVLNWEKCHFMVTQGIVLGHIVSMAMYLAIAKTLITEFRATQIEQVGRNWNSHADALAVLASAFE